MTIPDAVRLLAALSLLSALTACGSNPSKDGAPRASKSPGQLPGNAVPRPEEKSRYGNGPTYEVFGKQYTVMESAHGYQERGVASWYGTKFHGNLTSNREVYDMHEMTAAHKTLPLPTYVRVRNLSNNRTIIVRVNDRGPFVANRIIDLSYAAALKLDMIRTGTSLVEIEAISFEAAGTPVVREPTAPAPAAPAATPQPVTPQAAPASESAAPRVFVQIGAFGSRDNADRRLALLHSGGIGAAFILEDASVQPPLYRVRLGPIQGVDQYDLLVAELGKLNIDDAIIVTE